MKAMVRQFQKAAGWLAEEKPKSLHNTVVHIAASGPDARYTPSEQLQIDAINKAIDDFANVMREKMVANVRKKDGWRTIPIEQMWDYAQQEIRELRLAMDYESARNAQRECADVANFMMMLFHKLPAEGTKSERLRRASEKKSGGNF